MNRRRPPLLVASAILALAEAIVTAAVGLVTIVETITEHPRSYASAIALAVLALLFAAGLAAAALALLRGRAWSRAAIIVWQVIQIAVGASALTGSGSRPYVGWPLIVVAAILIVLVFTPQVLAATRDRGTGDEDRGDSG